MSLEKNKAIIRKAIEALNKKNLDALDELIAPDYVDHSLQVKSLEEFKQNRIKVFKSFPDWHMTIEDLIAEGDKVWAHFKFTGIHTGEYLGIAPTGKKMKAEMVDIFCMVDGKAAEVWEVADLLDFLKQLGVIEYTEKAKKIFPEEVS